jgi:predicted nicotinamide N-methyase
MASASAATDGTARYAWPAGRRLAADLPAVADLRGRSVADLGCGTGVCGRAAIAAGAASVLCADGDAAVVAGVAAALEPPHRACVHRWGEALPGGPFAVILGGDILYRPDCFADLLTTVALSLAPDGLALLADPRTDLEPVLPDLAAARRLAWATERRPGPYTLVRVRRSSPA